MSTSPATTNTSWSLGKSLLAIGLIVPGLFYLQFGVVDGYAIAFAAFLMLLVLAIEVVPRVTETIGVDAIAAASAKVRPGRFDFLGVVWLLSIPFAPFFGWILTNTFELSPANWRWLASARAIASVLVPLVCVLPLVRYVRGPAARFKVLVLVVGTAFPVITGLGATHDALRGALWQDVDIRALRSLHYRSRAGTPVHVENAFADLADGRTLRRADSVAWTPGPNRLLVLQGLGYALARH